MINSKTRKLKVLQVNIDDAGGAFSLMFQVQNQLEDKLVFDYFTMSRFRKRTIIDQIKKMGGNICEAKLRNNRLIGHLILPFVFYKYIKNNNYSIIHIHADTAWKLLIYAIPAKVRKISRIIVHAHSSNVNGDFRCVKYICHLGSKYLLPFFATDFVSCSEKATLWMFPDRIKEKVVEIHNGIDLQKFAYDCDNRIKIRNRLKIQDNEIVIGTVGDFSYAKNPYYVLRVFEELLKRNNIDSIHDYRLMFVGDGKERKCIEEYTKKIGLFEKVIFLGKTNNIAEIYSSMDLFVLASRFEGLPMSAIEAQTSGLYCLLSNKITTEIKCIDNCYFLDLLDIDEWVKMIEQCKIDNQRQEVWKSIKDAGFGIDNTTKEMMYIYGIRY